MIGGGPQKITVEIGGKIGASLGSALRGAQMQVSSFGRNVSRTMNDAASAGKKGFKGMFDNALWQQAAAGAAAIGVGMVASVKAAAQFEQVLSEIGKTSGATSVEIKGISKDLLSLSGRNRTNLGPKILADGVQDLVAQGLSLKDAVASIESLGRVATATNSELTDVTKTGFQLQNALKIRPTELKATFDALAFAGKQGAFELKDMAQFMPTIAAAAGTLGITGKQGAIALASMMQMVRKDAPDAGQASTRLTDAMLKMTAPDAVKNFKEFGVNIEQVLKNAKAKGVNPMEAALNELQRVTGGDAFKLGQIFGDKEAKLGLMSLMKYRKEYEKLKAEAGGSAAAGTVDKDYQRQVQTFAGTLTSFQNTSQRLGITLGNALLPSLTRIAEAITPLVEKFAAFAEENPRITTGIVAVAGAFAGLVAVAPFVSGLIGVITTIGPALGGIAAAATGPIGIAVLAVIGLGLAFKAAYDKLGWFRDGVNTFAASVRQAFGGLVTYIGGAWKVFTGILTGDTQRIQQGFTQAFSGLRTIFSAWAGWVTSVFRGVGATLAAVPNAVGNAFRGLATAIQLVTQNIFSAFQRVGPAILSVMFPIPAAIYRFFTQTQIGQQIVQTIINGLKARASALFGWISGAWARIKSIVGGGGGGGAPAGAQPPGRASGGPVRAGQPYIVGERRRELFVPGMDGAIIPRVARPVAGGGGVTINAPVTINAAGGDAMAIRDQVRMAFEDLIARAYGDYRVALND
jgi:TP901 family phage tail tape measure protein